MPQVVNVLGYGPVTFPDGMSREDIAEALKQLPPVATQQPPAPVLPVEPQTVGGKIMASPVGGALRGLRDVAEGTVQFVARGAEQLPGPLGMAFRAPRQKFEQGMTIGEQEYRQSRAGQFMPEEIDVGRLTGNIAGTLLPSTAAVRALKLAQTPVRAGAASGVVSGTMQPVQTGQQDMTAGDYWTQKAQQMGFGFGAGAAGGYLSDKMLNLLFGRGPTVAPAAGTTTAQAQTSATVTPTASVTGGQMTPGVVGADA
jgi:hypothetical protein